jgi:ATP-binding cassette subfamily B protein
MPEQSILSLLKHLWHHLSRRRRIQLGILVLLMFVSSFAEIISIGAILPFLAVLTAPDKVFSSPNIQPLIQALEVNTPEQLLLPLTIIFCAAALIAGWQAFVGDSAKPVRNAGA